MRTKIVQTLLSRGVRPSPQRTAVYEALAGRKDHPSAEVLFAALRPTMPTLSKTTVLNTLRLFQSVGLTRDVRCEEGELRFDGSPAFHAHFKCRGCGALFDIPVVGGHEVTFVPLPEGFQLDDEQVIYYGLCKRCSAKKKGSKQ